MKAKLTQTLTGLDDSTVGKHRGKSLDKAIIAIDARTGDHLVEARFYSTDHAAALAKVNTVRDIAQDYRQNRDAGRAAFMAFGTCSEECAPGETPIKSALGAI